MNHNPETYRLKLPWYFWVALAAVCVLQTFMVTMQWQQGGVAGSTDTDPWVRLLRVEKLISTGDWYDSAIEQINPPHGMISHWTRPLDVVLIVASLPLMPFMSAKSALFASAVWLNTVWLCLSACALLWALRPLSFGIAAQIVIAFGFVMDPVLTMVYAPGRAADHHSLLALLAIVLFGIGVQVSVHLLSKRYMLLAGLVAALGVWMAPEFLVASALVYVGFGISWLRSDRDALICLRSYGVAFCTGLLMALCIERGFSDLLTVQHDRLSVVHVVLAAGAYSIVCLTSLPMVSNLITKLIVAGIGGGVLLVAMQLLFPGFYQGPMAAMEPGLRDAFNASVNELQSAFNLEKMMLTVSFYDALLITCVIALLRFVRPTTERAVWGALLLLMCVFGGLVTYQLRWNYYVLPFGLVGLAVVADMIANWIKRKVGRSYPGVFVGLLIASSCVWPAMLLPVQVPKHDEFHAPAYTTDCSKQLRRMIQQGDVERQLGDTPAIVLTAPYLAPQLIYFTPYKVIASFYHNLTEGLMDINHFFYAETEQEALAIVKKWKVDYLLFCSDDLMKSFDPSHNTTSFVRALRDGNHPEWLKRITGSYDDNLLFFKVR